MAYGLHNLGRNNLLITAGSGRSGNTEQNTQICDGDFTAFDGYFPPF
jgi:hypothetical protein